MKRHPIVAFDLQYSNNFHWISIARHVEGKGRAVRRYGLSEKNRHYFYGWLPLASTIYTLEQGMGVQCDLPTSVQIEWNCRSCGIKFVTSENLRLWVDKTITTFCECMTELLSDRGRYLGATRTKEIVPPYGRIRKED